MHHTAIYKHFQSIDDVAVTLAQLLASKLREDLRLASLAAGHDAKDMIRVSTRRYFNYVREHPTGVSFCAREIHGSMPCLRKALQIMLDDFAADRAEDLIKRDTAKALPNYQTLLMLTRMIAHHTLFAALDYLEEPGGDEKIIERTIIFVEWLIAGAISTDSSKNKNI